MKKTLVMMVVLAVFGSTRAMADACEVTETSGSGAGTFIAAVQNAACTTITFSAGVTSVDIGATTLTSSTAGRTIDGGSGVEVTGSGTYTFRVNVAGDADTTISNVSFTNTNVSGIPFRTGATTSGVTVTGASIEGNGTLVLLNSGGVMLTQTNFVFTTPANYDSASLLVENGTATLSPPDATAYISVLSADANTWSITGTADSGADRIEAFDVDTTAGTATYVGSAVVTGGEFVMSLDIDTALPSHTFAFVAMDTAGVATSLFNSSATNPTDDVSFYASNTACADVTWLLDETEGGMDGDFDGDGIANGTEDANHDCVVDATETDPAIADTDEDTVADGADICPVTANADQADLDSDGTGDVCDDSDSDGVMDATDNCVTTANADQADADANGVGDACETTSTSAATASSGGCSLHANATSSMGGWLVGLAMIGIFGICCRGVSDKLRHPRF